MAEERTEEMVAAEHWRAIRLGTEAVGEMRRYIDEMKVEIRRLVEGVQEPLFKVVEQVRKELAELVPDMGKPIEDATKKVLEELLEYLGIKESK